MRVGKNFWDKAEVDKRFLSKIEKLDNGCWEWRAGGSGDGYGTFQIMSKADRSGGSSKVQAHRASWEIHNGPIPDGLFVCHHCDIKPCVNPAHLFLGTHQDNMADLVKKNRAKKTCRRGHPWSKENTIEGATGGRMCRACTGKLHHERRLRSIGRAAVAATDNYWGSYWDNATG